MEPDYGCAIDLIAKIKTAIQLFEDIEAKVKTCNVCRSEWHVYEFEDFKWLCQSLNKTPVTTNLGGGGLRWPYKHSIIYDGIFIFCLTSKEDG